MHINEAQIHILQGLNPVGAVETFREPLGPIFLPPDPNQRPPLDFIRRANALRQIVA
jgi:hypothetical protein